MKNKITKIVCAAALAFATAGYAQQFTWAKQFGINGTFNGNAVVSDNAGNVYFTGSFSGTGDQDPSPGTFTVPYGGSGDVFAGKMNSSGNLIWLKAIGAAQGDVGTSIALDSTGNVYVAGNFRQTVDFDPGSGTYTLQSPVYQSIYDSDAFILKLDNSGNFVWAGAISGQRDEIITDMAIKGNGIYVTGQFGGVTDFDIKASGTTTLNGPNLYQAFVASYDLDGNLNWADMMNGSSRGLGISLDGAGNAYTTGWFQGTSDFDPSAGTSNLISNGGDDIFIWKVSSNGSLVWAKNIGGAYNEQGNALAADASGNIYVTGRYSGTADFKPGSGLYSFTATPGTDPRDPGTDAFMVKLSGAGSVQWAKSVGSFGFEEGTAVALDMSGHVYIGGTFNYTVDFEPGYPSAVLVSQGMDEIFINKLTTNGDLLWLGQMGGPDLDYIEDIYIHTDNTIYLTGSFKQTADLDPTAGGALMASAGVSNAFVVKLNGAVDLVISSVKETGAESFGVFPNPCSGWVNVSASNAEVTVTVRDLNGRVIVSRDLAHGTTIDLAGVRPGVYLLQVESANGEAATRKLIVQ